MNTTREADIAGLQLMASLVILLQLRSCSRQIIKENHKIQEPGNESPYATGSITLIFFFTN